MVLWFGSERAITETAESFGHQRGALFGKAFGQLGSGFGWADRSFALEEDVAGVHSGVDAHGGDTGDGFAVGDGPLDGRCSAILRKQGSVEINPAEARDVEQTRGDDLAVGDDDDGVRICFAEELLGFRRADFFGLEDANAGGESGFFYGREGDFLAAAARPVRLAYNSGDLKVRLSDKLPEARYGEKGSSTKKQTDFIHSGLALNEGSVVLRSQSICVLKKANHHEKGSEEQ